MSKKDVTSPKGTVIYFSGPETYQLKEHVQKMFKASEEKYGETNVSKIDPEESDIETLKTELYSVPFFGTGKRIVFLESFPFESSGKKSAIAKEKEEQILELIRGIPEDIVVICVSKTPDRRTKAWKDLTKMAKAETSFEFQEILESDLTDWILQYVAKKGGKILPAAAEYLWQYAGTNLWTITHELDKLIAFTAGEKPISEGDINKICEPSFETKQFALSNAFSSGKEVEVLDIFHRMIDNGESTIGMLYRDFGSIIRNLILSRYAIDENKTPQDVGLNPFVFRFTKKTASLFSMNHLKMMHAKLLEIDEGTKTGVIPVYAGKEEHLIFALEKWIQQFFLNK